tara:strand:- start:5620 stop:6141 length:522 start_codon:yes stop_codon:yes gene_type:complete
MKKSEFRKFIREAIKSVLKELDGGAPLVAPDGTIQGGPKKKDDEESVNEAKMTSSLKRKLDKEYKDDYELKDHPDKKDKFYALLLKHVPKGNFGHLRKEVGKLFGFTNVQPGSNAGELIEYFRNLVIKGLGIKFRNELVDEDSVEEKVVFYKDKQKRLRRFDTDKGANKKYRT